MDRNLGRFGLPVPEGLLPPARFWIASASANVSRPHPCAVVIGSRKSPKTDRAPNPSIMIVHDAGLLVASVGRSGPLPLLLSEPSLRSVFRRRAPARGRARPGGLIGIDGCPPTV